MSSPIKYDFGLELRQTEIEKIEKFILKRIKSGTSGLLYLTGPPGTGKTMCTNFILKKLKHGTKNKIIQMNCFKISKSKIILTKLCQDLGLEDQINRKMKENDMVEILQNAIISKTNIIILDEIDQISKSKNIDLFKLIFGFPMLEHSKLILIAISNCISLVSHFGRNVEKITFRAYNHREIQHIVECYIKNDPIISHTTLDSMAIQLIAKRVAKESGDIRQAINMCRSIIDDLDPKTTEVNSIFSSTWSRTPRKNTKSFICTPPPSPREISPSRATTINVMASAKKRCKQTIFENDDTPFYHQVVLYCLYHSLSLIQKTKTKNSKDVNINNCYMFCKSIAANLNISLSSKEYRQILDCLESEGLVSIKKVQMKTKVLLKLAPDQIDERISRKEQIIEAVNKLKT